MKDNKTPEQLVELFNRRYPIGRTVRWREKKGAEYKDCTVKTPAFLRNGRAYVFFTRYVSQCDIDPLYMNYLTS